MPSVDQNCVTTCQNPWKQYEYIICANTYIKNIFSKSGHFNLTIIHMNVSFRSNLCILNRAHSYNNFIQLYYVFVNRFYYMCVFFYKWDKHMIWKIILFYGDLISSIMQLISITYNNNFTIGRQTAKYTILQI